MELRSVRYASYKWMQYSRRKQTQPRIQLTSSLLQPASYHSMSLKGTRSVHIGLMESRVRSVCVRFLSSIPPEIIIYTSSQLANHPNDCLKNIHEETFIIGRPFRYHRLAVAAFRLLFPFCSFFSRYYNALEIYLIVLM